MSWHPRLRPEVDLRTLPLDVQQGFLLSRLDGVSGLEALEGMTGLEPERLRALLEELVALGAVLPDPDRALVAPEAKAAPEPEAPDPEALGSHRSLFEQRLQPLPPEQRAARVREAEEPELSAYCFDPLPEVIQELFRNPRAGLRHARLVAAQHRTTAGLTHLAGQAAFAADPGVRRALLQNPVLPGVVFRRLWAARRLQDPYLVAISREVPEQTRAMAREALKAGFAQRSAEEKVELILASEGRCLPLLGQVTVDGHTTQLLCRQTYHSTLILQNFARWSAAPPALIAHLLRQESVRRNPQLRGLLERMRRTADQLGETPDFRPGNQGTEMAVGRGLRAYAFLQLPFASKLEGYQLFPHWTGSVGLTYHF